MIIELIETQSLLIFVFIIVGNAEAASREAVEIGAAQSSMAATNAATSTSTTTNSIELSAIADSRTSTAVDNADRSSTLTEKTAKHRADGDAKKPTVRRKVRKQRKDSTIDKIQTTTTTTTTPPPATTTTTTKMKSTRATAVDSPRAAPTAADAIELFRQIRRDSSLSLHHHQRSQQPPHPSQRQLPQSPTENLRRITVH